MNLYTSLCARLLFPLHEALKGHDTVGIHRAMEQSQWWDRETLARFQIDRLQRFLTAIGHNVPYYRVLFAELNFQPENLTSLTDLAKLPFLTKADIRDQFHPLTADNAIGLSRFNTGGSSGEPLIFLLGKERISHDVAAKWRATRWWDVDIGDREIVIWGSPIELGKQDRIKQLRDKLLRTQLLPAFEMSPAKVDGFIRQIRAFRPKMLFGYPSALAHIAAHAESAGQRLDDLGIKVAFVTSERLYDHQRDAITRVFGCPVANGYGGRDAGFIAHQCPEGGMHLTAEDIIVEIIDQQGQVLPPGEAGEIVVTHMATSGFPFVRYKTGDIGVLDNQPCRCGRGLPLLKEIQGRSTDFIVAEDGTVMHGLALIYVLRDLPGVAEFKITQHSRNQVTVQLVVTESFTNEAKAKIITEFQRRLGAGVAVEITLTEHIEKEKSGKFRYVVSHVQI